MPETLPLPAAATRVEIGVVPVDTACLALGRPESFTNGDADMHSYTGGGSLVAMRPGTAPALIASTAGCDGCYPVVALLDSDGQTVGVEAIYSIPEASDRADLLVPDPLTREQSKAGYALDRDSAAYREFLDGRNAWLREHSKAYNAAWEDMQAGTDPANSLVPHLVGEVVLDGTVGAGDPHIGLDMVREVPAGRYAAVVWTLGPDNVHGDAYRSGLYLLGPA